MFQSYHLLDNPTVYENIDLPLSYRDVKRSERQGMVGDILEQAGYTVVGEAATGTEAVQRYRELRPDFVTMDIVMPDMGGIDAVRAIRAEDPRARVLRRTAAQLGSTRYEVAEALEQAALAETLAQPGPEQQQAGRRGPRQEDRGQPLGPAPRLLAHQ